MRTVLFALLLVPSLVSANALSTRTLEPVVRISEDIIYVTDKKGNDWAVITSCKIQPTEVTEFTVRSRKLQKGTSIRLSKDLICEVRNLALV